MPANLQETSTNAMRYMVLSMRLRRVFGPLFGGEPSIEFRPDGTVRVTVGACHAEIDAAAARCLCGEDGADGQDDAPGASDKPDPIAVNPVLEAACKAFGDACGFRAHVARSSDMNPPTSRR